MKIAVLNQKGGAGKTSLSTNLAGELARRGRRVLIIDGDEQRSSIDWAQVRINTGLEPLVTVVGIPSGTIHKEIRQLEKAFDDIIIDGPARVSSVSRSAAVATDIVVVPVQPSPLDLWSAHDIIEIIDDARVVNDSMKSVFAINRKIVGTALGRDFSKALASYPNMRVLESSVAQRVIFPEAILSGQAVFEVDPKSAGTEEIVAMLDEILMECAK